MVLVILILIVIAAVVVAYLARPADESSNETTTQVSPKTLDFPKKTVVSRKKVVAGPKYHPKSRIHSIATTNGDYFEKCAPAVTCDANDIYRSYNGTCNNLDNPSWGAALTPFYRLANAEFDDGNINCTELKLLSPIIILYDV